MKIKILLPLIILFNITTGFFCYSQTFVLEGKISNSLQQPLAYANILAIPDSDDLDMAFAITNSEGIYKLKLEQQQTYEVTVSYLGFKPQKVKIKLTERNNTKDFVLRESPNQLETVELNYTPPITVKKDTIIYSVNEFTTGNERKLREVLKTLPGVEVDRAGNVTVQGKKVTKVLVEDKIFFTGDSKLAVNNIPADAVNKVEVIDNYNEVAMLKGLQDSEDMAINIKLKEDKKKFAFGDIEVGAGVKDRYIIHPNLFYYSPKTNINFIGDLNNTGFKSFTFKDYLEFEGGFGKLIQDASSYFSLYNSDFSRYLSNQDYTSNTNQFGAFNIRQSVTNSTDISAFVISSNSKTNTLQETVNTYTLDEDSFIENRTNSNTIDNFFTLGKFSLDYEPNYQTDIAFNSFVKASNGNSIGAILTESINSNNSISTFNKDKSISLKQNLSANKKLSKNHTGTFEISYTYQNDKPITNWITDQQILQGLVPLEEDIIYDILQNKKSNLHSINAIAKDYWVLNNFNHLYTSIGVNYAKNEFYSKDLQLLSDNSINDFSSAGFGNDFKYDFLNLFLGLEYKFLIGITTFKPALYAHSYHWSTQQLNIKKTNNKTLLLPQFTTKIEFNDSEKINIRYRLSARFPSVNQLANNFILSSFNSVFKGNDSLENQLYHSAALSYYKFSLFKKLNINTILSYNKKVKHFKTVSQLEGIEQYNTQILFNLPEQSFSMSGSIAKKINKIRYKFRTRYSYSDFYQIVNDITQKKYIKHTVKHLKLGDFF